jgi:peptidyl-prolyl cis-trans isomerase A (cyclophilin A)
MRKLWIVLIALGIGAASSIAAEGLMNPEALTAEAPAKFLVKFDTSKGEFSIEVEREWAPNGADRFYNLVQNGYFDDTRFFRVLDGFVAQFGINGDPTVAAKWKDAKIEDDPVTQSNKRGTLTFATSGKDSRTTQMFINFKDNTNLDGMGFSPIGKVVEGIEVVDSLYKGYGEGGPRGRGPAQHRIQQEGNAYLEKDFPRMDYVKTATVVPGD